MTASPLSESDQQAWQRAVDGDAAARQELVERMWRLCQPRLRAFAAEERREIEQSMAAALLRALSSGVTPTSNLAGLLEWRGRGEITAYVRTRVRQRRFERCDEVLAYAGHDPSPFDAVASDELRQQLLDCISRIPNADHRDAVQARLLDGLTPGEFAARRQTAPSVIRVWLTRAMTLVRHCLEAKFRRGPGGR